MEDNSFFITCCNFRVKFLFVRRKKEIVVAKRFELLHLTIPENSSLEKERTAKFLNQAP